MRIAVISDTHGRPFTIPPCDVFIHCGDITAGGTLEETEAFAKWLRCQDQVKVSLLVPGNHDRCFQEFPAEVDDVFCEDNVCVLVDKGIVLEGIQFWGSPWTPPFMDWWFMADEDKLHLKYMQAPEKIDVLITHGPPHGIQDPGWQAEHVGSTALLEAVNSRKVTHHVFGHLHGAGGGRTYTADTNFYNVAACDDAYTLVRQPIIIDL
jgi:Icc-related predicted phosphoesterase